MKVWNGRSPVKPVMTIGGWILRYAQDDVLRWKPEFTDKVNNALGIVTPWGGAVAPF